jgi:peroxiredoxin
MMGFTLALGASVPDFNLKGVDGKMHQLADYAGAKVLAVIVTCNHCPTAVQYEDRIVALQRDYQDRGVQVVAINGNEIEGHPTDSFEHMVARASEKSFNFPYLRDDTQEYMWALGAGRTPEVFLFGPDRKLAYHGRIDDNPRDAGQVTRHDLREALDEVLAGKAVSVPQTKSIGCNVKWIGKDPHWTPAQE